MYSSEKKSSVLSSLIIKCISQYEFPPLECKLDFLTDKSVLPDISITTHTFYHLIRKLSLKARMMT